MIVEYLQLKKMQNKRVISLLIIGLLAGFTGMAQHQAQTQIRYLSGTDNQNTVAWDFWATGGRNSGFWSKIEVPSHWEQQGFGAYNYGRDYVTYGRNFRFEDEKGVYRHVFSVPLEWRDRAVYIVFEGSMTDTEVKINGKPAGPVHRGAFYRFKYDISDKLNYGQSNQLDVTVSKMSSDKTVNDAERLADYWILGGIYRPVYLEAQPKSFIDWTSIDAQADGSFRMNVHLKDAEEGSEVHAEILDAQNNVIARQQAVKTKGDSVVLLETRVHEPMLWTAETPHLYQVRTSLKLGNEMLHQTQDKFGFRTIEIRLQDGIYLNGVKIKMKGVNRHVWWPETGRSVNRNIDLMDAKLIKEMNMNAVRTSHYPPDKSFLEICDSLGIYVLDELAGWQKAYSTEAGAPLVRSMVQRDANHPSIIFWSNGNEGGHNMELAGHYEKYDLSARKVVHGHHRPGNHYNGIDGNHYEDYYSTQSILADTNIYMTTEFLHAQDDGGGGAGLEDIWELHWQAKRGGGGFLWTLVDEGLVRTDQNNIIDVNGVNAPDGLVGPHRQKEGSVYAIREIFSPVHLKMKKLPEDFDGTIPVENRFHFTNFNACSFQYELLDFRHRDEKELGYTVKQQGHVSAPDVEPLAKGKIKVGLPVNWRQHDALSLIATDPLGNEIHRWVWKIKTNAQLLEQLLPTKGHTAVEVAETDTLLTLKAEGISVTFDKTTGLLAGLANDYSAPLSFHNGPVLVGGDARFEQLKHYPEAGGYAVESSYTGDMESVRWKMHESGWLELTYAYTLAGTYPFTGISFDYPENFVLGAKWLGKGPSRVWKNRPQGVTHSVWQNRNNNTHTGSAPWIYPEFKGYYADVSWMEFNTVQGKFTVASADEDLFVRLFDFYALSGDVPHPDLPAGDISFLDCIPPTGTKLALRISRNTSALGPQSEPNNVNGTIRRTLWFYFGLPKLDEENRQFVMPEENILTDTPE